MPIYEYECRDCGKTYEILLSKSAGTVCCSHCNSENVKKILSAHSSMSGSVKNNFPGAGDTACCGSAPGSGNCAGPGTCCGKA